MCRLTLCSSRTRVDWLTTYKERKEAALTQTVLPLPQVTYLKAHHLQRKFPLLLFFKLDPFTRIRHPLITTMAEADLDLVSRIKATIK